MLGALQVSRAALQHFAGKILAFEDEKANELRLMGHFTGAMTGAYA